MYFTDGLKIGFMGEVPEVSIASYSRSALVRRPLHIFREEKLLKVSFHDTIGVSKTERRIPLNYTYIVRCSDGTYYTGWTNDLEKRVEAHNTGKGAKYTRTRCPVILAYYETFQTKQEAMRREWQIKHLTRQEKEKLMSEEKRPEGREAKDVVGNDDCICDTGSDISCR